MISTPFFDDEFAAQVRLAREQLRAARSGADDASAQAAAARLAELEDLWTGHLEPALSGGPA